MSKKSKDRYLSLTPEQLFNKAKHVYMNKYFNIFMNGMEWGNLTREAEDYVMRKFWAEGKISAFKFDKIDELGFAPYGVQGYGLYDVPTDVNLINERNVPGIPTKVMKVDKDVVLGFYQRNHKPVCEIVSYYVDRMAQIDIVINTNLWVHEMPFLIGIGKDPQDKTTAENIINKILGGELVVFASLEELNQVKSFVNNAPYIIDKLYAFKNNLESELLTYLGMDNSQIDVDKLAVDQINANNQLINANAKGYERELNKFCDKIKEVLGFEVTVKTTNKPVESVHQDMDHRNSSDEDKSETGGTL